MQPRTPPVRTITNFDQPLRCMDDMMLANGKRDIYITSAGVPDATGMISAGTKEMLITAVAKMSERSGAFRFVDYDPTQLDVQVLSELVGLREGFTAPSYYIRGAITQLDSNVLNSQEGAALSMPYFDLGVSRDQVVSVISVDLNIGKLATRQILPGMSASNSMAVVRSGKGADAGGIIGKAGLSITVSLDRSEGFHQAVRNLIELSTIESLGKLTRVPYWQCLELDPANPSFKVDARERALPVDDAIGAPRVSMSSSPDTTLPADRATSAPRASVPPPPGVTLQSDRGPRPAYHINEALMVRARTQQDAFLYCYYQDSDGQVARIFPNRFQPNAFVRAGAGVDIPPGSAFQIRFDKPGGHEAVACIASDVELGTRLPPGLKARDLEPLPVKGLNDVVAQFRAVDGRRVSEAWLPIEVSP